MTEFLSNHGIVTSIENFNTGKNEGCYKIISVEDKYGATVNFVVSPDTYFLDHATLAIGDRITGFSDANAAVPLIYPPQYRAIVIVKDRKFQNVKVSYFNYQLLSSDGTLKLNIAPYTEVLLQNDQVFTERLSNRNLIVVYGASTRSIPAQTTPQKIIVLCQYNNQ